MDVGGLIRIRNAAREALGATPADQGSAWRGLVETYENLRSQTLEVLGSAFQDEFESLFPQTIDQRSAAGSITNPSVLFSQQDVASEARTRIASVAGWLDGIIEEAQFEARLLAEAAAYARERVKAERGVGFQPPDTESD